MKTIIWQRINSSDPHPAYLAVLTRPLSWRMEAFCDPVSADNSSYLMTWLISYNSSFIHISRDAKSNEPTFCFRILFERKWKAIAWSYFTIVKLTTAESLRVGESAFGDCKVYRASSARKSKDSTFQLLHLFSFPPLLSYFYYHTSAIRTMWEGCQRAGFCQSAKWERRRSNKNWWNGEDSIKRWHWGVVGKLFQIGNKRYLVKYKCETEI